MALRLEFRLFWVVVVPVTENDYRVELRGGQEPVGHEVDEFVRGRGNSMGPEFATERGDHIHEGWGFFV